MSIIKELSSEVIAKIAAGEVVERPASVVKEIVENALDAGAREIKIELEAWGRKLIRVTDDGEGMGPEDVRLAIQRHTTSKIESEGDLWEIQTFGFRGEALSSIGAVAKMRIITRQEVRLAGTSLSVEGGVLTAVGEAGCPPGTSVEVRELFWNIPARLKFLKSHKTELAQNGDVVARMALANPTVHFQLFHDGRILANYPVRQHPSSRLDEALGGGAGEKMHPFRFQSDGITVEGFAAEPGWDRPNGRGLYLFVNRRPVRDKLLTHAVLEGYRNLLPPNRYPTAVVFVDLPPSTVDVNVHPSKWEVKFADTEAVHRTVVRAIRGMLEKAPWLKEAKDIQTNREIRAPSTPYHPHAGPGAFFPASARRFDFKPTIVEEGRDPQEFFLGQVDKTYLIFASPGGLVLVDQHAAHERIRFEQLQREFSEGEVHRQSLLFPEAIELPLPEIKSVEEHQPELKKLGFELEPSGPRTFWVKAVPSMLANRAPLVALREMIQQLSSWEENAHLEKSFDPLLRILACHSAVRASQIIGREEALALLSDLQKCAFPSNCPHGRPTLLRITLNDLEKMFGRKG